jgi:peptide/nickel transport system ATP-binding protein
MQRHEQLDRGGPAQPLLIVNGLKKHFPVGSVMSGGRKLVRAVDGIDLSVNKQETLGIVGESGCGKSTVSRLIMSLLEPTAGEIIFDGDPVGYSGISLREYRRQVQMVFQDSYSSLNPRLTIEESIAYGPSVHGVGRREAVARARDLLAAVGLAPGMYGHRFPHQLSGGQRQRVNIARALALRPRLVILDEPVSALDKSVEAQVLNLLMDLKAQFELTYLFISHDLNVVQHLADRVLVMYLGKAVEVGPVDDIFAAPAHPYTRALMDSRPSMDPQRRREEPPLKGDPPNPIEPPSGCRFHTRCPIAREVCSTREPPLYWTSPLHVAACHAVAPESGYATSAAALLQ